jgi:hypothetical protein
MPHRPRAWPAVLMAAAPFLFQACEPAEPAAPPKPASALYECRGIAPYAAPWKEILKGLDSSGVVYCAPPPAGPPSVQALALAKEADTAGPSDSVRAHVVVLDGQCRFLEAYEDTLALKSDYRSPYLYSMEWPRTLADGSPAPTGEYFLNAVQQWPDGRIDTTWAKIGIVRTQCGI